MCSVKSEEQKQNAKISTAGNKAFNIKMDKILEIIRFRGVELDRQ